MEINILLYDVYQLCERSKLIGASYFYLDKEKSELELSPEDFEGHGTHTSSTAAGAIVEGANLYGMANGTARGAVPAARIAMYKVCWARGCSDIDILAAFDAAIADGVDVLSISVGGSVPDFFSDSIAIGAFHASQKGIFVSTAAGNSGPSASTVENTAPWILSVGASSTDRLVRTEVALGNGKTMQVRLDQIVIRIALHMLNISSSSCSTQCSTLCAYKQSSSNASYRCLKIDDI